MKVKLLFFAPILAIAALAGCMQNKPEAKINVTGVWADSNSTAFQHCYVIFSQQGSEVTMLHYLEFNESPLVEEGKGTVEGSTVNYDVVVTKPIEGWATSGKHSLTLSPDGKTLRGTYLDGKGNKGPLVFKKLR